MKTDYKMIWTMFLGAIILVIVFVGLGLWVFNTFFIVDESTGTTPNASVVVNGSPFKVLTVSEYDSLLNRIEALEQKAWGK